MSDKDPYSIYSGKLIRETHKNTVFVHTRIHEDDLPGHVHTGPDRLNLDYREESFGQFVDRTLFAHPKHRWRIWMAVKMPRIWAVRHFLLWILDGLLLPFNIFYTGLAEWFVGFVGVTNTPIEAKTAKKIRSIRLSMKVSSCAPWMILAPWRLEKATKRLAKAAKQLANATNEANKFFRELNKSDDEN